jgi:hypothetical protein
MIKLISFKILFFLFVSSMNAQDHKLIASCCDAKPKESGRCTGSAYCSACSNCSRCAHCSNGGSCGVCTSYSPPVRYTPPSTVSGSRVKTPSKYTVTTTSNSNLYSKPKKEVVSKKVITNYRYEDMLAVDSEVLNLREGPGTEYGVIEVLERYAVIKVIAIDGEWLQVKVIESGNNGFVNVKYVYKI